ncbi:hypothetical protein NE237_023063 [Protea cynaroides]|uniref:Reverse transcriptase zinc-binding domain-containing protein n=1 Tax=Protea cynaroides TaxID=273540 RepID=A0A9Q0K438_9MAGN|nr:hypothetical protein NE237_023063 [Protea cynaroides]
MWKEEILHQLFSVEEVAAIKGIPLSFFPRPDRLIWKGTKNGRFTVKSAYHLLSNLKEAKLFSSPTSFKVVKWRMVPNIIWKQIWNCKTLPKIKEFLWRSCGQGVASSEGLIRRNILVDRICRRCGMVSKTIDHLLLTCPFARAAWHGSSNVFFGV